MRFPHLSTFLFSSLSLASATAAPIAGPGILSAALASTGLQKRAITGVEYICDSNITPANSPLFHDAQLIYDFIYNAGPSCGVSSDSGCTGMAVYGTTIFEICGPKGRNALCRDLAGYLFQLAFRCSRLDNVAGAVKIQGTGEQLGLSLRLRKI